MEKETGRVLSGGHPAGPGHLQAVSAPENPTATSIQGSPEGRSTGLAADPAKVRWFSSGVHSSLEVLGMCPNNPATRTRPQQGMLPFAVPCFTMSTVSLGLCSRSLCRLCSPTPRLCLLCSCMEVSSLVSKLRWGLLPCSYVSFEIAPPVADRKEEVSSRREAGSHRAKLAVSGLTYTPSGFLDEVGKNRQVLSTSAHHGAGAERGREGLDGLWPSGTVTLAPGNHGFDEPDQQLLLFCGMGGGQAEVGKMGKEGEDSPHFCQSHPGADAIQVPGISPQHFPSQTPPLECSSKCL